MTAQDMAKEDLKDHSYTCLVDNDQMEAWRCQAPGTSIYGFDIVITQWGIAVFGDIDGLTFRVGRDYGMAFLAGDDVNYYIRSKLDAPCRETELDPQALNKEIREGVINTLSHAIDWEALWPDTSKDEWESRLESLRESTESLREFLDEMLATESEYEARGPAQQGEFLKMIDYVGEAAQLLEDAPGCEHEHHAYELLNEAEHIEFEMCELRVSRPATALTHRLHLVNQAAKSIMKIKREMANEADLACDESPSL